jgi:anthranilate 1,2-dioxygenase (deaminating, decarboxylating) large subunit
VAPGQAYELPPLNLGFTSFLDGGPPAGPGFYYQHYAQYWNADQFTDDDGKDGRLFEPLDDPELEVFVNFFQFIYQSNQELLLGGKWGLDLILPYVSTDLDWDEGVEPLSDNGSGFGDILVGPYLQWDPIMGKNGPVLMHRIELQMIFPTGKYDDDHTVNPGANHFYFNPYYAVTLFLSPKLTFSTRIHYLWNAENDEPSKEVPPTSPFFGADDVQAGQAMHLNFATAYELVPKRFRVGLNGYVLKQFTDTKVDGDKISGTRERILGIGPGAVYHFSQDNHIFLNTYVETAGENRPEGYRLNLRWTHHF